MRQATAVRQARWTLTLIRDGRRVDATATLSGSPGADREQLKAMLADLRGGIGDAPVDPYLLYPDGPGRQRARIAGRDARTPRS